MRGLWDGSSKINGDSRCGDVIKGMDRDKRITSQQKFAVFLRMCTAKAVEVVGVCDLTGILDLVWGTTSV